MVTVVRYTLLVVGILIRTSLAKHGHHSQQLNNQQFHNDHHHRNRGGEKPKQEAEPTEPSDSCGQAELLEIGSSVSDTTERALDRSNNVAIACHGPDNMYGSHVINDDNVPGLWYKVRGTGAGLTAFVCPTGGSVESGRALQDGSDHIPSNVTDSDGVASITVYEGRCRALECVSVSFTAVTEDSCEAVAGRASWFAEEGVTYHVLVKALMPNEIPGPFLLDIQVEEQLLSHDICEGALPVDDAVKVAGTLGFPLSSIDFGDTCVKDQSYMNGLWFVMEGTGEPATVVLGQCTAMYGADDRSYRLTAYTGDCQELICLGYFECDAFGSDQDSMTFDTIEGEKYFLLAESSTDNVQFSIYIPTNEDHKKLRNVLLLWFFAGGTLAGCFLWWLPVVLDKYHLHI